MKYSLSTREIPRAEPKGFSAGLGYIFYRISQIESQYRHSQFLKVILPVLPFLVGQHASHHYTALHCTVPVNKQLCQLTIQICDVSHGSAKRQLTPGLQEEGVLYQCRLPSLGGTAVCSIAQYTVQHSTL